MVYGLNKIQEPYIVTFFQEPEMYVTLLFIIPFTISVVYTRSFNIVPLPLSFVIFSIPEDRYHNISRQFPRQRLIECNFVFGFSVISRPYNYRPVHKIRLLFLLRSRDSVLVQTIQTPYRQDKATPTLSSSSRPPATSYHVLPPV